MPDLTLPRRRLAVLDDWQPATYDKFAAWARSLNLRCASTSIGPGGHSIRTVLISGTVSVKFGEMLPKVIVEWGGDARGEFPRGLPLTALAGLISGLLQLEAEVPGGDLR